MSNPELHAKDQVDTKEQKPLQKEAKDTELFAHPDLINMILEKYADKIAPKNKDNQYGKDERQLLATFQRIASDPIFGVWFVESAVRNDASYEDILEVDKLIDSMSKWEIVLIQKEIDALKKTIETPQSTDNEYKDIADFSSKQQAESRNATDVLKGNATLAERFKKNPKLLEDREKWETNRKSDVEKATAWVAGVDADSINNISAELTMTRLDKTNKQLEITDKDTKLDTVFDNSLDYANSMLDKTSSALKEIQQTKVVDWIEQTPHELSELPLFMVPGELRSFYDKNGDKAQPEFTSSLADAMKLSADSVKDSKDLVGEKKEWETLQHSLEQLMEAKMPELSKKEQDVIQKYVERVTKNEWKAGNMAEGLKGFISQIAEIIKAIREGFSDVWWDIASNPDMKAALTSLGIFNVEEIDAMFLKKDWEIIPWDATSIVNTALKKDLFNPNNTEDCLSNMFNEWATTRSLSEATSKEYIKNNKGTANSPQEHVLDTILAVMHKDSAADQKKELRDNNGEFNMNKVDAKYKEYKNHMINTVWAGQNVRWNDMHEDQQQEMVSRSLVKNNSASLLYYKETVLPELQKLDTQKATDAVVAKANAEAAKVQAQSSSKETGKPATTT